MDTLALATQVDTSKYSVSTTRTSTDRGTAIAPVNPQPVTNGGRSVSVNTNAFLANSLNQAQNKRPSGASGTFTTADGKTVTVNNGLITSIA